MEKVYSAGVVVYFKKNGALLYLLLHNVKGHWDFPKGKIEAGEDKETAALRELQEEAGITVTLHDGFEHSISYVFTADWNGYKTHKTVYYFVGMADSTNVQLSHEHDDFIWLSFESALKKVKFKESQDILIRADQFLKSIR